MDFNGFFPLLCAREKFFSSFGRVPHHLFFLLGARVSSSPALRHGTNTSSFPGARTDREGFSFPPFTASPLSSTGGLLSPPRRALLDWRRPKSLEEAQAFSRAEPLLSQSTAVQHNKARFPRNPPPSPLASSSSFFATEKGLSHVLRWHPPPENPPSLPNSPPPELRAPFLVRGRFPLAMVEQQPPRPILSCSRSAPFFLKSGGPPPQSLTALS